jgi:asparagine synthase (glutamine-hydrolysing)
MVKYQPFCFLLVKSDGLLQNIPSDFKNISPAIYYRGDLLTSNLIGNIHAYLPEYKNGETDKFLKGLNSHPKDFLHSFVGDFSFVYFTTLNNNHSTFNIIAARDHMGIFPLYYYNDKNYFIVSNDQRLMIDIPLLDLTADEEWKSDLILSEFGNTEYSYYKKIRKVPPAHLLTYHKEKVKLEKYWTLNPKNNLPKKTDKEYIDEFRKLLVEAVECRIPDGVNVGSEVSGGIDCTSVAAIAKSYLSKHNRNLYTYAHASVDNESYPCEREAIEKFLTSLNPYKHSFAPGIVKGYITVAQESFHLRNGVLRSSHAVVSRVIYEKAAEDQVKVIFSGNGGDHCVSFRGSWSVIQQHIVKGRWKKAMHEIKISEKTFWKISFRWCMLLLNICSFSFSKKNNRLLSRDTSMFEEKFPFLKNVKKKKQSIERKFLSPRQAILKKLSHQELINRSENTTVAATELGVIYRYPLLDIRLLQYFLSLPDHMLHQHGRNRYIFREAIKNYVPTIAYQPKPPSNMYGWLMEGYRHDFLNNISYTPVTNDVELRFYYELSKSLAEYSYKHHNYFK